ncbi:cytochrome c3 family protein [Flavobacteriaceae bacterium]|jgi:mono/diheme cytochrome c family protein|nr:cytochrome c3 family protein [Flavobacteriaceae bacterium]
MKSVYLHKRLTTLLLKSFTFLLLFSLSFSAMAQDAIDVARQKEGRKLYNNLCASCHKLDRKLIGPALAGVTERRENDWLKAWIKNNAALRASGDRDAIAIFNEYNGSVMSAFPQLSDTQIDDILYYTEVGDPKPVLAPGAVASTGGQNEAPGWLIYILAAIIVSAFLIIAALLKTISELKGAPKTPGPLGSLKEVWAGIQQNTFLHVVGVIFLLLTSAYLGFGTLFSVGVDQGYQPVQPIAFSHKIHAGENKVDCQYCHSSAKHSKHSGIPSVNVCMNCHKNIAEVAEGTEVEYNGVVLRKNELDKEIQKIYDAAGWDAENLEYTGETKPIKWIRIHNLPDHVNFVHAQHVTVAGVDCKQCHGPVEEMDEMYQYSPLTMGWCIDCHRETNVDLKGNPYYEKIHKQLAEKYGTKEVTIAQLGGLECGKCHH